MTGYHEALLLYADIFIMEEPGLLGSMIAISLLLPIIISFDSSSLHLIPNNVAFADTATDLIIGIFSLNSLPFFH